MADNRNTLTDEILVLAETLGDIKARFERVESEFAIQSRPLEAALAALSAAMTGIKTLQHHVLDNSLSALSLKVEEQRKAIDDQINVIVGELKGADAQNDEKIALQTAELKQQFAEICANVQQLSSQFDAQIKRVELEAKEQITKFAAVTGPQGPAGASFNPKGNWQEGVFYQRLDVVSLLGTSYVSNVDNNASKPTKNSDKWTVLAARAGNVGGGGAANFGSIAGVAEINQGGTGQTTALAGARALLDGISTTTGDILYRGSSGWTSLTAGAADTVLKSQGSGAAPQWAATSSATAATDAQAAAGTSTTTFVTPANAKYAAAPVVNGRAPRQGLVFDGTAGATFGGVTFGSSDFTVSVWISVNSLSGNNVIIDSIGGGNNFALYVATDGSIRRLDRSTSTTASTAAGVISVGKTYLVTYVRGAFYINGVLQNTFSDTSNYSTSMARIGWAASSDSFCTGLLVPLIYNRALSASEVVALYEAGAPAGADYATPAATNTNQITGDAWWNTATGSVSSGTITLTSGQYVLRGAVLTKGKRYRTTYNVTALTGTVQVGNTSAAPAVVQNVSLGAGSFEFTANDNGAFGFNASSGTATINNVTFIPVGLLLAPDAAQAGGGLTWYDTSGNAANITLPASGASWNVPFAGYITAPTTTNLTLNGGSSGASLVLQQGTTGDAVFSNSANTGFIVGANNATSGTGAFSALGLLAGTRQSFIYRFSEGYSSSGYYVAGALVFENNGTAGHMIFADAGSESMRITATNRNLLIGTTTDGGQKLQVAGSGIFSSTESAVTLYATASGGIQYQLISGGALGHALGAFKIVDSSTGYVVLNHDKPTSGGTRLSFDGAGNATFAGFILNRTNNKGIYTGTLDNCGFTWTGTNGEFSTASGSLILKSAGTTALTLDSSQNATFAGTGTSSFAGNLNIKGALGAHQTAALNLAYEGSSVSQLVAYGADASTLGRVNVILRKAGTGTDAVTGLSVRDFGIITQGGVAQTPASASATGTAGTIQWDASYIYVCTATNTWKRVAIATW